MTFITKLFCIVDFPDYYYTKKEFHRNICGKISLLRIFLMVMIVKEAISIPNLELYREIPKAVTRYKRQVMQEESRPHGHASWIQVAHPNCPRGRYTGQVVFDGQGLEAVPDGNGTFTCVQQTSSNNNTNQMARRGTNVGQENGVFESYTGAWREGLRSGLGVTNYRNGDIYSGAYANDKRNGQGDMVWAMNSGHPGSQNQRRYVGQYVEDQRNGRGEMTYPNGDRYTGDWVDGNRSGKGLYLFSETGNRYKGDYVNNKKEGDGLFWWTAGSHAGDKYEGQFKNDQRHGRGIYRYSNGDIYDGNWENGKQHGEGLLLYKSGNRLQGSWKNGKRDGQMVLTVPSGDRFCASFLQDERQGEWVLMAN